MTAGNIDEGYFESELSLGEKADRVYLEIRHRVLTGIYRPGQLIDENKFADAYAIDNESASNIFQALVDHGYFTHRNKSTAKIVSWSDKDLIDTLSILEELIELQLAKAADRMDTTTINILRKTMDIDLSGNITAGIFEAFNLRWWMYFHTILYSTEIKSLRKIMLIACPPVLRRRMLLALDHAGLRSMHSDMKATTEALESNDLQKIKSLMSHQWRRFVPQVALQNSRFESIANADEIDYADLSLPDKPIFQHDGEFSPLLCRGFREPLNWDQFQKMGI